MSVLDLSVSSSSFFLSSMIRYTTSSTCLTHALNFLEMQNRHRGLNLMVVPVCQCSSDVYIKVRSVIAFILNVVE